MEKHSTKPDRGIFVSPYLRRPLRTFEQFVRDQAERTAAPSHVGVNIDRMDDHPHRKGPDDGKLRL